MKKLDPKTRAQVLHTLMEGVSIRATARLTGDWLARLASAGFGSLPDADSKLVPCWHVGGRGGDAALVFLDDLASRLAGRVQLSSDQHHAYSNAVEEAFGADVDYGQIVKIFGQPKGSI